MKKRILFLLPALFLGLNSTNLFFINNIYNKKSELNHDDKIINLSLGNRHSGVTVDTNFDDYADTLYMWGDNSFGQIGNKTLGDKILYPKIISLKDQDNWNGNIIDIDLGGNYSGVTIDTDLDGFADTLYMWGDNSSGQLGDGTNNIKYYPTKITPDGQEDWNGNIINLSLGMYCSGITIDTDLDGFADTLYMWGDNYWGQIGNGESRNIVSSPEIITPQNQDNWDGNIIDLSLGGNHSGIAIDTNLDGYADTLYMWGYNFWGQVGEGTTDINILSPEIITPQDQDNWSGNIINLSLSLTHSGVTIDTDLNGYADTLYMWGYNNNGQIGDGKSGSNVTSPEIITPKNKKNWKGNIIELSLGESHSGVIIDTDSDDYADTLYMWGYNEHGQIGDGKLENKILYPKMITPQDQDNWDGNIIDLSLGIDHTGIIVDINKDGYGDTLYMWGKNDCGQIGNWNQIDQKYPNIIISNHDFNIKDLNFYNTNHNIELNLILDDYQNILNKAPEIILIDSENNNYTTTFINNKSNINNDQYYYQLDNNMSGKNYNFTKISINNNNFILNKTLSTDYLISDYTLISSTEDKATINLDLSQNSNDFNILNYTNQQKKIEVNYTNIDNNVTNSQQFNLDQTNQIILTNLNAETDYRIDSINYFYQSNNYKYTIETQSKIFQTSAATPLINANSISLIKNSLTINSFEYTIEIDNLKENNNKDNFTQYDIDNGIWLLDQEDQTYNSSFINKKVISNGEISGTQNYQLTFLQRDLIAGQTYNFTGIGFNDPNGADPYIINFPSPFEVTTVSINKKFIDNTFKINSDSISTNSFKYTIAIDNLVLIDDTGLKPIFANFSLDENLYLKDNKNQIYSSSYINNSDSNLKIKNETVKYQFSFKVSNLQGGITYNFINLSFTNSFEESIDISENGIIKTSNNSSEKLMIWIISVLTLISFVLLLLILILIYLKIRRTK